MKVTPTDRKFGSYKPGDEFSLPDKVAAAFIKTRRLRAVEDADLSSITGKPKRQYRRRDLRAED